MRRQLSTGTWAEIVKPTNAVASRGLVVIPDIWGMRPLFDHIVARLATQNDWAVGAFDLFHGRSMADFDARQEAIGRLRDSDVMAEAGALADELGTAQTGLVGFCTGGMYAEKAAATGAYDRIVSFYGHIRLPEPWQRPGHGEPLDALWANDSTDVLCIIGSKDIYTPQEAVVELRRVPRVTVLEFEEAEHGFAHDPSLKAHRSEDAAMAWAAAELFLSYGPEGRPPTSEAGNANELDRPL